MRSTRRSSTAKRNFELWSLIMIYIEINISFISSSRQITEMESEPWTWNCTREAKMFMGPEQQISHQTWGHFIQAAFNFTNFSKNLRHFSYRRYPAALIHVTQRKCHMMGRPGIQPKHPPPICNTIWNHGRKYGGGVVAWAKEKW